MFLVIPGANVVSEHSCSTLWLLKTFLRATISQEQLNDFMLLKTYKVQLVGFNLVAIANFFSKHSGERKSFFATSKPQD